MRQDEIMKALEGVGHSWTRQIKAEEKSASARSYRASMYTIQRTSLKEICYEQMPEAWAKASGGGRLPTHWRQIFYVMRPICDAHPESDRPLSDTTFKQILEAYLEDYAPGWDVLRGARGVFKEPHAARNDSGLPMSTLAVRDYLHKSEMEPSGRIDTVPVRFPTLGARNRIAACLICEKEGFDQLLQAERVPERYDLALMSTKGISAKAARDLAEGLGVPCFTLHDMDKNGFVMAGGFWDATDIGIRLEDVEKWDLEPESTYDRGSRWRTRETLIRNGATEAEADFIADGQRVELNMLTGPDFIAYVEEKLQQLGVKKVIPDERTLELAWKRALSAIRINRIIYSTANDTPQDEDNLAALSRPLPPMPPDLADQIRAELADRPTQSWDEALWILTGGSDDDLDDDDEWDAST